MRPSSVQSSPTFALPAPSARLLRAAFAALLFVLILSAKWATFDRYGSAMPDWDQWDAEAMEAFLPWFQRDNFLQHLFHPHNEHRVILTKLHNLALVLLNGQWDSRLEAVTNAVLHAALATAFWLLGLRFLFSSPSLPVSPSPRLRVFLSAALFLLTFALHGLPLAWQNVLGGFHSQQYWLLLLSFAALVTLPFARAFSARWWLGAVSGFLALGSMGSGFLAAAIVILVLALRLVRRETTPRAAAPTFVLCLVLIAIGILTRHEVPWHAEMKAKSVHDFAFSIIHSLQWPWRERHWAAPILWLPWLLLSIHLLRRPASSHPTPHASHLPQAAFGLGAWVLLQLVATAYARGAGAGYPASRYMDTLVVGILANALCLVHLLTRPLSQSSNFKSQLLRLLAVAWLLTTVFGIRHLLRDIVQWEIADAKKYYLGAESNLRRFLATGDRVHLAQKDIPYPDATALGDRLTHPLLRPLMPVPLRAPLALSPAPDSSGLLLNNATAATIDIVNPPRAGLSPATPPLDYAPTWGSFGSTEPSVRWRSAPLEPTGFAFLKFEVAGDLSPSIGNVVIELRDARTDEFLTFVRPSRAPGDRWRSVYVRMPRAPFVVIADDRSPKHWLAFSPPVEMAALSYYAWQATKHALLLFYIAAALTVALVLVALGFSLRRATRPSVVA